MKPRRFESETIFSNRSDMEVGWNQDDWIKPQITDIQRDDPAPGLKIRLKPPHSGAIRHVPATSPRSARLVNASAAMMT